MKKIPWGAVGGAPWDLFRLTFCASCRMLELLHFKLQGEYTTSPLQRQGGLFVPTLKKRNWAAVVYPESLPEDWEDILMLTGLPAALSPLHDRDLDPTGDPKKPHYHLILCYPGPTTYGVVKDLCDRLHAPGPQPLDSVKGYYRYLTHQDNPDKAQYNRAEIRTYGGFNILDYSDLTSSERLELVRRVQQFVIDMDLLEYSDLLDALMASDMPEEYDFCSRNTILFNSYVSSRRHKRRQEIADAERRLNR